MTRRVFLYFVLTLGLGIIVGACGFFFIAWNSGYWHRERSFDRARAIRHFKQELNLSDSQVQQLSFILDEASKKFADAQKQHDGQLHSLRVETRDRIRKILTPEQVSKFDDMVRRRDERRPRR